LHRLRRHFYLSIFFILKCKYNLPEVKGLIYGLDSAA